MAYDYPKHGGRHGIEQDDAVTTELSKDDEYYCIILNFYGKRIPMHTRTAVDLHHKLGLSILDWIGQQNIEHIID